MSHTNIQQIGDLFWDPHQSTGCGVTAASHEPKLLSISLLCFLKIQMPLYFPFMHTGHWKMEICSMSSLTFALTALFGFQTSWILLFANIWTPFGPLAEYITRTGLNDLNWGSSFGACTWAWSLDLASLCVREESQRNGEERRIHICFLWGLEKLA